MPTTARPRAPRAERHEEVRSAVRSAARAAVAPGRSARRRTWPATPAEQDDRDRVIDLIRYVGRQQLRFTVRDLRRAMLDTPRFQLAKPDDLARHVAALMPATLMSVGQPTLALHETSTSPGRRPARARHVYVLTERLVEHAEQPPDYTDPERVYVALWVAAEAANGRPVETNAVTRVCRTIEALTVDGRIQMSTRLAGLRSLAARADAPAASDASGAADASEASRASLAAADGGRRDGRRSRWRRWRPCGRRPEDPRLEQWITLIRTLEDGVAPPSRVGHVTLNDIMSELVRIAVERTRSAAWPLGRSVTAEDIAAACAEDRRAHELDALLVQRGTTRGKVLGDVARVRIGGRSRVVAQVIKVGTPPGGHAYYDVAGSQDIDARALVVPYRAMQAAVSDGVLDDLRIETRAARSLGDRARTPTEAAIAAVRLLLVHLDLARLQDQIQQLLDDRHLLSQAVTRSATRRMRELEHVRRVLGGDLEATRAIAEARVAAVGLSLDAVLRAPRPLLVGDEYAAWLPTDRRAGRSGAQLLADAKALPRYANPAYTSRGAPASRHAAPTGVDRVDALVYLAEKLGARTLAFLQEGADLLGRAFRDPALVRPMLGTVDDQVWSRALSALVLLGDASAEAAAHAVLERPGATSARVVRALYALSVMRRVEPDRLPEWLLDVRDRAVLTALRAVLHAPRRDAWLL